MTMKFHTLTIATALLALLLSSEAFLRSSVPHLQWKFASTKQKVGNQPFQFLGKRILQARAQSTLLTHTVETGMSQNGDNSKKDDPSATILQKEFINLFSSVLGNAAVHNIFPVNSIGTILGSVVENVFLSYFTGNKPGSRMKRLFQPFESNLVGVMERPRLVVTPLTLRDPVSNLLQGQKPIDPVVSISRMTEPKTIIKKDEMQINGPNSELCIEIQSQGDADVCQSAVTASSPRKVPLPFMNLPTIGISGDWTKVGENYVLYPVQTENDTISKRPRAIIHFLGAAFVGAAPHMSYRFLLESLGALGYVVVATPYKLDFDYLTTCDSIMQQVDLVKNDIAARYGEVPPVIGMGHSGGALLQMFLSSFFQEDANKHGNIFLGINDRPLVDAVPAFQDLIVPLARRVMGTQGPSQTSKSFAFMRKYLETAVGMYSNSSWSPSFFNKDIVPLFQEGLAMVDQVPPLLKSIANGTVAFHPPSQQARDSFRLMYRAKHTLLIKLTNDTSDESIEFERILNEANTIMKMKQSRNLDHMIVDVLQVEGNGYVPFTQSITANISDISSFFKVSGEPLKFCSKSHKASLLSLKEIVKNVDDYIHDITVPFEEIDVESEKISSDRLDKTMVTPKQQFTNEFKSDSNDRMESTQPISEAIKVTEFATECHDAIHNVTIVTTVANSAKYLELKKIFDVPALKTSQFVERLISPKSINNAVSRPSENFLTNFKSLVRSPLHHLALGFRRLIHKPLHNAIRQLPTLLQHLVVVAFLYYFPLK